MTLANLPAVEPRTARAHGAMLLSTLLVATSHPVVASIAGALDSRVLVALRFVFAALLFAPLVAWRHGRSALPSPSSLGRYALLSAPLVGFFLGMFEALRTTTAVRTGALLVFAPGFAALFSVLLLRERIPVRRILGLALGMVGASWVVLRGDSAHALLSSLVADGAWFSGGPASLGLCSALIKRLRRGEPMEVMTFWTLATGAAWLVLLGRGELAALRWSELEPRTLAGVAYLAVFSTMATSLLSQSATVVIGATRAMAYSTLNPALVALVSWTLGAGALGVSALPGVGLTLLSMLVLQRDAAPPREPRRATARLEPCSP